MPDDSVKTEHPGFETSVSEDSTRVDQYISLNYFKKTMKGAGVYLRVGALIALFCLCGGILIINRKTITLFFKRR